MENKKLPAGLILGYLITSYFSLPFPGFGVWVFVFLLAAASLWLYLLWLYLLWLYLLWLYLLYGLHHGHAMMCSSLAEQVVRVHA